LQYIADVEDVDKPEVREKIDQALRASFKPEFLNRIDDIIVFHKLGKEQLRPIVEIQLGRLRRLLADKNLTLELAPAAIDLLVERGYDPTYGARPLKRVIQRTLQDPLAKAIIAGSFKPGDRIRGERVGDEIQFGTVTFDAGDHSEAA
jgi:ATP-dependent Clp protease ATP-binding subunit ClpB